MFCTYNNKNHTCYRSSKMGERFLTFKFILVGDSGVGKTSISKMFCERVFDENQTQTIALDFGNRTIDVSGTQIKIQVWDTAGQERFHSITRSYFRNSVAVFCVYDISNRDSFSGLQKWIEDTINQAPVSAVRVIVGNKTDVIQRSVSEAEAEDYAKKNGFLYFETSALSGHKVEDTFIQVAQIAYERVDNGKIDLQWSGRKDSFDQELSPVGIETQGYSLFCCK